MSYTTLTQPARTAARAHLRAEKVAEWEEKISQHKARIAREEGSKARTQKKLDVATFDFSRFPTEHPAYEDKKKDLEETTERLTAEMAAIDEMIEYLNKEIAKAETILKEWETGVRKVDRDAMLDLAEKLRNNRVAKIHEEGGFDEGDPFAETPEEQA